MSLRAGESREGRIFALHAADLASIPTIYGPVRIVRIESYKKIQTKFFLFSLLSISIIIYLFLETYTGIFEAVVYLHLHLFIPIIINTFYLYFMYNIIYIII